MISFDLNDGLFYRYLIGPSAKYIDDKLILLGAGMSYGKDGYFKIADKYLTNDLGSSDANGREEMKDSVFKTADWTKLAWVVRGNFSNNLGDSGRADSDTFPAGFKGIHSNIIFFFEICLEDGPFVKITFVTSTVGIGGQMPFLLEILGLLIPVDPNLNLVQKGMNSFKVVLSICNVIGEIVNLILKVITNITK